MIEFSIDMEYCLDRNKLDCVILHDENEEMDDMVFVPERITHNMSKEEDRFECELCGERSCCIPNFCLDCGAKVVD